MRKNYGLSDSNEVQHIAAQWTRMGNKDVDSNGGVSGGKLQKPNESPTTAKYKYMLGKNDDLDDDSIDMIDLAM